MTEAPSIRVLLVEDNAADARLLVELLKEAPGPVYAVTVASSLSQAKALLDSCDVVLLDLSLPDGHGFVTVESLLSSRPKAPVIILTGHSDDALAMQAVQAGAQDYLVKNDLAPALVARTIRYAIERVRAEESFRQLVAAQAAQAKSAEAARRAELLAEAGSVLASSLTFEETAPRVAELMVRTLADACVIELEKAAGIAVTKFEAKNGEAGAEALKLVQGGAPCTTMVPLVLRGQRVGTMCLAKADGVGHTYDDIFLIEEVGRRIALAIESARLYKEARAAVRAREEMMAVLSHDLRNPLNVFSLSMQSLQGVVAGDPRKRETLARADRAFKRMKGLLEDLLDASRIDEGTLRVNPVTADLSAALAETVEMQRPMAAEKSITLECHADPISLRFDRDRVGQVLTNLLGNALKFTPDGGTISVTCQTRGTHALVSVTDTGPGIAQEHLRHVFDRFWQSEGQERRSGIGLGLTIAKGIVEAHGGTIKASNAPGKGACFQFTLPLPRAEAAGPRAQAPAEMTTGPNGKRPESHDGLRGAP